MITFTRSWRGYAQGSSVQTLAPTLEALAVAEGAAVYGGVNGPPSLYLAGNNAAQSLVDTAGNTAPLDTSVSGKIAVAPVVPTLGLKILTAVARNASDYTKTNSPLEIRVNLPDGWAPSADCIRVRDSAGAYVAWQWEPCLHARTGADVSTHASTNIKAGSVWVLVPSLAAHAEVTYTVEVWPAAQTQSFTAAIAASAPSGKKRFTGPDFVADFWDTWYGNLASYTDTPSTRDFFSAVTSGVDPFTKDKSGGTGGLEEHAGLVTGTTSQTSTSKAEVGTSNFGYGNVFCEWRAVSAPIQFLNINNDVTYRIFADGSIRTTVINNAAANLAPGVGQFAGVQIAFDSTGATYTSDGQFLYQAATYSNAAMLCQFLSIISASDADGASFSGGAWPGTASSIFTGPNRIRVGWAKDSYTVPSGATRREIFELRRIVGGDITAARAAAWTPLITTAAIYNDRKKQLYRMGQRAQTLLGRYTAWSYNDTPSGQQAFRGGAWVMANTFLTQDNWIAVPGYIAAWLAVANRTTADSGLGARLFANYKAAASNSGFEFVGTDADAFYVIAKEAQRRNDQSVYATCVQILIAIAEFGRLAEADFGSNGKVILNFTDSPSIANINSSFAAAVPMAYAEALGYPDAARTASLDRIWSALQSEIEFGWVGYLQRAAAQYTMPIANQALTYLDVVMLGFYLIPQLLPRYSTSIDVSYPMMATTNALGQALEHRFDVRFDRRGLQGPLINFAANLALFGNVSEIEQGIVLMDRALATGTAVLPFAYVGEGWANTVSSTRAYGKTAANMTFLADQINA